MKGATIRQIPPSGTKPDEIDWDDPQQVEWMKWLCEQECPEGLSALARHVIGDDYFGIVPPGEQKKRRFRSGLWRRNHAYWRTCGVVDWGPHRLMLEAVLGDRDAMLVCSRDGLKSSVLRARLVQKILIDRDIRIIFFMETLANAETTVDSIRVILKSERVALMWGDLQDPKKTWKKSQFFVAGRSNEAQRVPTMRASGADVVTTGDHCDIIATDDPVSHQSARSVVRVENAVNGHRDLQPLLDDGGYNLIALTPYVEGDVCDTIMREHGDDYHTVLIPCGVEAYYDHQRRVAIRGYPIFPHMTERYLLRQAKAMHPKKFNLNYGLTMHNDEGQTFRREQLIVGAFDDRRMGRLRSYVLTDFAFATNDQACFTVYAIVALDWDDTAYVIDLRMGRWESEDRWAVFADLWRQWATRVRICGIAVEEVSLNLALRTEWQRKMRESGITCSWIPLHRLPGRGGIKQPTSKIMRIEALASRVAAGKLMFLDTIRPVSEIAGKNEVIFDPQGFAGPGGKRLPSGMVVDQFIKWRPSDAHKYPQDVPDCLAALDEVDGQGIRRLTLTPKHQAVADPVAVQYNRVTSRPSAARHAPRSVRQSLTQMIDRSNR